MVHVSNFNKMPDTVACDFSIHNPLEIVVQDVKKKFNSHSCFLTFTVPLGATKVTLTAIFP